MFAYRSSVSDCPSQKLAVSATASTRFSSSVSVPPGDETSMAASSALAYVTSHSPSSCPVHVSVKSTPPLLSLSYLSKLLGTTCAAYGRRLSAPSAFHSKVNVSASFTAVSARLCGGSPSGSGLVTTSTVRLPAKLLLTVRGKRRELTSLPTLTSGSGDGVNERLRSQPLCGGLDVVPHTFRCSVW